MDFTCFWLLKQSSIRTNKKQNKGFREETLTVVQIWGNILSAGGGWHLLEEPHTGHWDVKSDSESEVTSMPIRWHVNTHVKRHRHEHKSSSFFGGNFRVETRSESHTECLDYEARTCILTHCLTPLWLALVRQWVETLFYWQTDSSLEKMGEFWLLQTVYKIMQEDLSQHCSVF